MIRLEIHEISISTNHYGISFFKFENLIFQGQLTPLNLIKYFQLASVIRLFVQFKSLNRNHSLR